MKIKHTFAVCAYGDSPYLGSCLRSLRGQTEDSQIILCTSTPSPYLEKMAELYEVRLYVRQGASNIRDDWNFAYSRAEGELVTIAHQDDIYHREYTASLLAAAEKWPDMSLFTTDYVIIKGRELILDDQMLWVKRLLRLPLRLHFLSHLTWIKLLPLRFGNSICCPSVTYRKSAVGEVLVDSPYHFALDWDCLVQLARKPGRFICQERPLLYYRVHRDAATRVSIEDQSRMREEREMFGRFWPEWMVRLLMRGYRQAYEEYQ